MSLATFILSLSKSQTVTPVEPPEEELTLQLSEDSVALTGTETWMNDSGSRNTDLLYKGVLQWSSGRTFFVYQTDLSELPFGQARLLPYHELGGIGRPRIVGTVPAVTDTHNDPAIAMHGGKINVFQENTHDTPIEHYQAGAGLDFSKFVSLTDIATKLSYCHLLKDGDGNYFIWSRGQTPSATGFYAMWITEATGIESWGSQRQITERPLGDDPNLRHYPFVPFARYVDDDGYIHLLWASRNDANLNFYNFYHAKTPGTGADSKRLFINTDGTFERHTVNDGVITDVLSIANYRTHTMDTVLLQGYPPVVGISRGGNFYQIIRSSDEANTFSLKYFFEGSWHTKAITLPWTLANFTTISPFSYLMVHSDDRIWAVVSIVESTFTRQRLIETIDQGDTWDDLLGEMFEVGSINTRLNIPDNIFDIPLERNFPWIFTAPDLTITDRARIWVKDAAFNALQAKPGIAVTAATDFNPRGLGLFRYNGEDANITRSGNDITGLTDLFGLRNATGFNNPQWVNSSRITTNGTSSYFTIANVAEIAACNAFTFICVARKSSANSHLLALTDNTGSTEQMIFQIGFGASVNIMALQFAFPAGGAVGSTFLGQDSFADGLDHVIVISGDGNKSYMMSIDGKMQFFETGLTGASSLVSWQQIGKGPASITTINAANIGRRDLTTDSFTPTDWSERMFYSDVLTNEEHDSIVKAMCVKYGITYKNEFILA